MTGKWQWLTAVLAVLLVFAAPSPAVAAVISPKVVMFAGLAAAVLTAVISVVQGLASKTINLITGIGSILAVFLSPQFAGVLPQTVVTVIVIATAVLSALTPQAPAAAARRTQAGLSW